MALTLCIVRVSDFEKDPVAFILSQTSDGIKKTINDAFDAFDDIKAASKPWTNKPGYIKYAEGRLTEALKDLTEYIGSLHHSNEINPEIIPLYSFDILVAVFTAVHARHRLQNQEDQVTMQENLSTALAKQFQRNNSYDEMLNDLCDHFSRYVIGEKDPKNFLRSAAEKHRRNPVFYYEGLEEKDDKTADELSEERDTADYVRKRGIGTGLPYDQYKKVRAIILDDKSGPGEFDSDDVTEIIPHTLYLGKAIPDERDGTLTRCNLISACKREDLHDTFKRMVPTSLPEDKDAGDVTAKSFYDVDENALRRIISEMRLTHSNFVASVDGNTRSALLVMIYLCTMYDVSGTEAYDFVKAKRPTVFTKVSAPKYWEILQLFN